MTTHHTLHLTNTFCIFHPTVQKPDNVGFDAQGNVKIFDFGFARELHMISDKNEVAGTPKYMAPECFMKHKGTCLASDVYSFSIVLWQICTLRRPFSNIKSQSEYTLRVAWQDKRPTLKPVYSASLRKLLTQCWDKNPTKRPTFTSLRKTLESTICDQETIMVPVKGSSIPKRSSCTTGFQKLTRAMALPKRTKSFQNQRGMTKALSDFSVGNTEGESIPFDLTDN